MEKAQRAASQLLGEEGIDLLDKVKTRRGSREKD